MTGGAGDDWVIGGQGTDTATFDGTRADFAVERTVFGYRVTDFRDAASTGVDHLIGVESLAFIDGIVSIDSDAVSGFNLFTAITSTAGRQLFSPGAEVNLVDAPNGQTFDVALGAAVAVSGVDGPNSFNLEGSAEEYQIVADGTRFLLIGPDSGGLAMVPDATPQTLVFADGKVDLMVGDGNVMMLGDQDVTASLTDITASLDGARTSNGVFDAPAGLGPSAATNVFATLTTETPELVLQPGANATLVDAAGVHTINISAGAALSLNSVEGANVIRFQQDGSAFTAANTDGTLVLTADDGAVTRIPAGIDPQVLVFGNGSTVLQIENAILTLGDAVIGEEPIAFPSEELSPDTTSEGAFEDLGGRTVLTTGTEDLFI